MRLEQNTVLITGASEGIGRAAALRFAAQDNRVVAAARGVARLEELKSDIDALGRGSCDILPLDVSDPLSAIARLREFIRSTPVDILVANAGIGQYGRFEHTAWEDVAPLLRTNVDGVLAVVNAVFPSMCARGAGSIVLVSSTLGKRAVPYNAAYCASKYAVHGFADALRLEARPCGVHVGVVCPARTDTRFFDRMTYSTPQRTRRNVPTSSPDRVADAILRCVRRRRREVVVSPEGKLFAFAGVHFPRISDFLLYHSVPRPNAS
jgi:short-subunit dehydrogenase